MIVGNGLTVIVSRKRSPEASALLDFPRPPPHILRDSAYRHRKRRQSVNRTGSVLVAAAAFGFLPLGVPVLLTQKPEQALGQ